MKAIALGAHILDILGKYVTEIPEGQGGALIDEIRLSPAGAAGGTAGNLAKLGAETWSMGAAGEEDARGVLVRAPQRFRVRRGPPARPDRVATARPHLPLPPDRG